MTIAKAELHVHLEGTIRPELAKQLAARNHLSLAPELIDASNSAYVFSDFMDFLKAYDKVAELIKHPEDYYDITFDYLQSNAKAGAIYIEMMYSPDHAEKASGIPSHEHLKAIAAAIDDAEKAYQIIGRVIITAVRHFGEEAAIKVARGAIKEQEACIVGFGLGGDELNYPPQLFQKAYEIAAAGGLQCTIHAGEFAPASTMIDAMECLPIKRIGHGVMAMHCPETIARLVDKNIALEICPSSNIALGLFKDLASHPLVTLMNAGVSISINSDDPPFFKTNLANEYEKIQAFHQFSDKEMRSFTKMAIESAFVEEGVKAGLRLALDLGTKK